MTADVTAMSLPVKRFDGAWIRWVLSFVAEPRAVIASVAAALRPGGVVVLQEYCDYRAWKFFPRDAEHEAYVAEVIASWRRRGGDPDIGFALPALLRRWSDAAIAGILWGGHESFIESRYSPLEGIERDLGSSLVPVCYPGWGC